MVEPIRRRLRYDILSCFLLTARQATPNFVDVFHETSWMKPRNVVLLAADAFFVGPKTASTPFQKVSIDLHHPRAEGLRLTLRKLH